MASQAGSSPVPDPEPAAAAPEVQDPADAGASATVGPAGGLKRLTTDKVSAFAAAAGVVITALGLYLAYGRDEVAGPSSEGTLGPVVVVSSKEAIDAEGTYEDLAQDQAVIFMVQPAESDPIDDTWITMIAERTPVEKVDGAESGEWRSRWPVADPEQAWRHAAGIGPAVAQGVEESETLSRLAEEGPDSSLLTSVTEVSVYEPEP